MSASDDLKKFAVELHNSLQEMLNKSKRQQIGTEMRDIIYKRTKSGRGVYSDLVTEPGTTALKKLSKPYVEFRKNYAGQKGDFFGPSKSNLTLTGQMLNNITFKETKDKISVYVRDNVRSDGLTNSEVAEFVRGNGYSSNGRPFLNLSKSELRVVKKMIEDMIRENIRRKFGKGA